jgi:two-component system, NarL family, response regulator NreC
VRVPDVRCGARAYGRPMEPGLTIVVADDHAVVRTGIRLVLEAEEGWHVVAEAGTTPEATARTRAHAPDVLVLDLGMPGGSGLDVIGQVRAESPRTRVVVLTMQDDPEYARRALGSGASAYVLKESADDELVGAVRAALAGRMYLAPRIGAALAAAPEAPPDRPDSLSGREAEVLRLIALGHTNAEIARRLHLSVRTIETHRGHIQQKTRRSTRAELVAYALEHGFLTVPEPAGA